MLIDGFRSTTYVISGNIFNYIDSILDMIFISQIKGSNTLLAMSALQVGKTINDLFGVGILYGMNSAVDSLISQAIGSKNKKMAGIYLAQGKVINYVLLVPVLLITIFQSTILNKMGQANDVCDLVFQYSLCLLPGVAFDGLTDLYLKFLVQTGRYEF